MKVMVDQIFQEAIASHNSGDLEEAKRLYSSILKVEPTHPRVIHNLGLIDLSKGKVASALQLFEEAIVKRIQVLNNFGLAILTLLSQSSNLRMQNKQLIREREKEFLKKYSNALKQKLMSVKKGNISIKSPPELEIKKAYKSL